MSEVIKVEHLSKKYIIRHQDQGNYKTLRDNISNGFKNLINKNVIKTQK